ncbi:diacylglycerol kinase [Halopseudomonas phragmitis]|mgnify:CR=1 FL=1|uniref:Diacylglycerol kinase n=2 Tax=Pseudomonadaceae TaxID=135621 RepID=A0A1V0B9G3_9GAMM|nr:MULTISPECIES: diacylglycerol kinase [Pseudomonadaceae]AQZ96531.1 diacylglycerol kinase [Halopseudomonas phragmitis]PAU89567.1 diacylglycerol kinase [Pseudomonas sp. WN033]RHW21789.1 diacylglycerol kinase [Pseudomonas jilinensis]
MSDNPYKGITGWRRIWRAAGYSLDGLSAAYRGEAAFRQLVWLALVLIPLAIWLPVDNIGRALMIGSVLLSLIIELLNSAIEAAIDRISLERHPLSKASKDMGSAAQMLGLLLIIVVWSLVLLG